MGNILKFTIEYEQIIRGDEMNKEQIETPSIWENRL